MGYAVIATLSLRVPALNQKTVAAGQDGLGGGLGLYVSE